MVVVSDDVLFQIKLSGVVLVTQTLFDNSVPASMSELIFA